MGDEYPGTGCEGELTAPKSAPSHSARRAATVLGGRAVPVCWKVVKPAGRVVNVNARGREAERASRMRRPACGGGVGLVGVERRWGSGKGGEHARG